MHTSSVMKVLSTAGLLLPLASCASHYQGTIHFVLNGGTFTKASYSDTLVGRSNTAISETDWPSVTKDGYYFVGWREKTANGSYREIHKQTVTVDGQMTEAYVYPIGSDTLYAYFEPLEYLSFNLNDDDAEIVAPTAGDADDFDKANRRLAGYSNKPISEKALPTAKDDTRKFQYWYTEYPFTTVTSDEGKVTSYVLDKTKEKGEYRFGSQFGINAMVFPSYTEGDSFELFAKWVDNPTVTLDFNIDGIVDYSYTLTNENALSLEQIVKTGLKTRLNAEYEDGQLLYQDKKLRGLYVDPEMTVTIGLNTSVETDITIYFRWAERIMVTFDYQGGAASGETILTAYQGDVLSDSDYKEHIPTKEDADFLYYTLNNAVYHFGYDSLPDTDCTLVAKYANHPVLTLKYDFAKGLAPIEGFISTDFTKIIKSGETIQKYLDDFRTAVPEADDNRYQVSGFYTLDPKGGHIGFNSDIMPGKNLTLYLAIAANCLVTYQVRDTDGNVLDARSAYGYYGEADAITDITFSDITKIENVLFDYYTEDGVTYVLDGLFGDADFQDRIQEDRVGITSETECPSQTVYRKAVKAITLTFEGRDKTLDVLPGGDYSAIEPWVKATFGPDAVLKATDPSDGKVKVISRSLPTADTAVTVE